MVGNKEMLITIRANKLSTLDFRLSARSSFGVSL